MGLLRALQGRSFALLWAGQTISLLGDRIFQVVLAWWILEKTGSAVAMGTVFIVSIVPMLIFLLYGGVLVDRFPRLWLMLISDGVRAVVMGWLAVLAATQQLEIWHVYVFSLVAGFVEAFFQPAYRAVVPEITPEADLPSANSLSSLSGQFVGIVGPALAAFIVLVGGSPLAFALNALSFVVSAACLFPIRRLAHNPKPAEAAKGILSDVREGFQTVLTMPWLWVTILVAGLSNIAYAGPMEVGLPFLIQAKDADVGLLGLFHSAAAIGSILAAIWMGRLKRIRRRGLALYGAWLCVGGFVAMLGLHLPPWTMLLAALGIGACNSILGLVWVNSLQEVVPNHLLGRVNSIDYLGSFILLPVGYAVGGWATELIGVTQVFIVGGLLQALLIALGLLHPRIRSFD
jgi:MFS family permease